MLETKKTISINGTSKTSSGATIATMHCSINENGNISINSTIHNRMLYDVNKEMVCSDLDSFTAMCRDLESPTMENPSENESVEIVEENTETTNETEEEIDIMNTTM